MVPPPPRRTFETSRRPRPNIRLPGRGARDTRRSCQSARRSDRNVRPSDRNARGLRQNAWRSPHGAWRRDSRSTPRRTTAPESPGGDGRSPSRSCVRTPCDNAPERSRATRQRAGRRRRVKLEDRAPEDATSARRRLGRPRARTLVEDARESPATFKTAWRNQIRSPTLIHVESNPHSPENTKKSLQIKTINCFLDALSPVSGLRPKFFREEVLTSVPKTA